MVMKRNRFLTILLILVLSLTLIGCQSAPADKPADKPADQGEKLVLKLSSTSSKGGALYESGAKFKELVEERSNGMIEVQLFADGQLAKDLDAIDAHQTGAIEMSLPSTCMAQIDPKFGVFDIPFLFKNHAAVQKFAEGDFWKNEFQPLFEQNGLVGVAMVENGFRHITNNKRPIVVPEDLKGIKLRVPQSKLRVAMFQEFGANPITMDFSEVFTALQQGVVDGQENPYVQIEAGKFYEVQKYLSITYHTYTPGYLTASKVWWDGLTQEQRDLIEQACIDAGTWSREYGRDSESTLLQKFKDAGIEVNEADLSAFQAQIEPVIEIIKQEVDPAFVDAVLAEVKRCNDAS
jgi:tripartite ATP-independent transporter DctP family solute receptor